MKKLLIFILLTTILISCSPTPEPIATQTAGAWTLTPEPTTTQAPTSTPLPKAFGPKKIQAYPEKGFCWPYYLYIPAVIEGNNILVLPNNTGKRDDNWKTHEEAALKVHVNIGRRIADSLGIPLLVPVFPRPDNETDGTIASQYLGRGSLEEKWQEEYPDLYREDLQLVAMIDDAREKIQEREIEMNEKIFLWGYSASGLFVSRFIILHPNYVKAAVFGGHGWTIAPVEEWEGVFLPFPYGIGDIELLINEPFDFEAFNEVKFMSYMGELDDNGWAMPWYVGKGNDRSRIYRNLLSKFGSTSTELLNAAEMICESTQCSGKFTIYPDIGHEINREIDSDILDFFEENLDMKD